eukprot:934610-Lingulodinium_polyedra.AAC.1
MSTTVALRRWGQGTARLPQRRERRAASGWQRRGRSAGLPGVVPRGCRRGGGCGRREWLGLGSSLQVFA